MLSDDLKPVILCHPSRVPVGDTDSFMGVEQRCITNIVVLISATGVTAIPCAAVFTNSSALDTN